MKDELEHCFKIGMLKQQNKDLGKAKRTLIFAEHKINIAQAVFKIELYDDAIINAYNAMLQAERALLFKDGVKERSHFCAFIYLKEKYKEKIEPRLINELNNLRFERHELTYGPEIPEVAEVEAESAISAAKDFIKAVRKLL